jgi:AhpD family alkylhydroperoxidase
MAGKYDLEKSMAELKEQIPEVMGPFGSLREQVSKDGLLSAKTKRLMMVAVSVAQRCEFCIRVHVKGAVELGASKAEILETALQWPMHRP